MDEDDDGGSIPTLDEFINEQLFELDYHLYRYGNAIYNYFTTPSKKEEKKEEKKDVISSLQSDVKSSPPRKKKNDGEDILSSLKDEL